jgi:poly-beta-1,6-N-acetyl-D-glucosamine synthase
MDTINNILLFLTDYYEPNLIFTILFGLTLSFFAIQLLFYSVFYFPIIFRKETKEESIKEPVSIIICAKNEEENLKLNLPKILSQDYPTFEVIVVNDASTDNTEEYLGQLREKEPKLKFTNIPEDSKFNHGKKLALTIGIKAAKYENLILTDADCYPSSKKWIEKIQNNFNDESKIVLGLGKYENKKGFLNKLIRFDTLFIALQYFGFAKIGIPYMGVGRNLAYKKSLFFENKGFASHAHILSGDDDLFINSVANKKNTTIEYGPESYTISTPETTFTNWVKQKKRHLTTGKYYKFIHKFLLFIEPFSRISFYVFVILLLGFGIEVELLAGILVFKVILLLTTTKLIMKRFEEKGIWFYSLIFDILIPFINTYFLFSNYILRKNNKWK